MNRDIFKDHEILQEDIYCHNYSQKVQGIVNTICDSYREEIEALHKMYRLLLEIRMHQLREAKEEAQALRIAVDTHNQKMLGNIPIKKRGKRR